MVNINISLTEEAYNYLKNLKGKDKSFSDVVIEMKEKCAKKGSKELVMKYFGRIEKSRLDELEKRTEKIRDDVNRELNERVEKRINDRTRH
jgi:predicted CopG family antitoxin